MFCIFVFFARFMGCVVEFFRKAIHLPLPLQARDLNLDQQTKTEGASRFAFQKLTPKQTEMRAIEASKRLSVDVQDYVKKKYWTQAANVVWQARRQP